MPIRRTVTRIACGMCVLLINCDTPVEPDPVLWEGELVADPVADTHVTGSIAMVAGVRETRIGIGVSDGPPAATLRWSVREGSCETSGNAIGPSSVFPDLTTSAAGEAAGETSIRRRVNTTARYAAEVLTADPNTPIHLACADLERVE